MAIKLKPIQSPDPKTHTIMVWAGPGPMMRGTGSFDYECAGCSDLLLEKLAFGQVTGIVIEHTACGTHSVVP